MIDFIRNWFERQTFGICDWLGEILKIRSSQIRLFFIYASFIAIGSPLILYLTAGFIMRLKQLVFRNRGNIFDS